MIRPAAAKTNCFFQNEAYSLGELCAGLPTAYIVAMPMQIRASAAESIMSLGNIRRPVRIFGIFIGGIVPKGGRRKNINFR